jgi:hypothetical protein
MIKEDAERWRIEFLLPWYAAGTLSRSESNRVEKALQATLSLRGAMRSFSRSLRRRSTSTRHSVSRRRASQRRYSPRSILRRHVRPIGGGFIGLRRTLH